MPLSADRSREEDEEDFETPSSSLIVRQVQTIRVDELLTIEAQKEKLSGNSIVILNKAFERIEDALPEANARDAAFVADKAMAIHTALNTSPQLGGGSLFPNFATAKRIKATQIEIEN